MPLIERSHDINHNIDGVDVSGLISCIDMQPLGNRIATGCDRGKIKLWVSESRSDKSINNIAKIQYVKNRWRESLEDLEVPNVNRSALITTLNHNELNSISVLRWSPCGNYLASADSVGTVKVWSRIGLNPNPMSKSLGETDISFESWSAIASFDRLHSADVTDLRWICLPCNTGCNTSSWRLMLFSSGVDGSIFMLKGNFSSNPSLVSASNANSLQTQSAGKSANGLKNKNIQPKDEKPSENPKIPMKRDKIFAIAGGGWISGFELISINKISTCSSYSVRFLVHLGIDLCQVVLEGIFSSSSLCFENSLTQIGNRLRAAFGENKLNQLPVARPCLSPDGSAIVSVLGIRGRQMCAVLNSTSKLWNEPVRLKGHDLAVHIARFSTFVYVKMIDETCPSAGWVRKEGTTEVSRFAMLALASTDGSLSIWRLGDGKCECMMLLVKCFDEGFHATDITWDSESGSSIYVSSNDGSILKVGWNPTEVGCIAVGNGISSFHQDFMALKNKWPERFTVSIRVMRQMRASSKKNQSELTKMKSANSHDQLKSQMKDGKVNNIKKGNNNQKQPLSKRSKEDPADEYPPEVLSRLMLMVMSRYENLPLLPKSQKRRITPTWVRESTSCDIEQNPLLSPLPLKSSSNDQPSHMNFVSLDHSAAKCESKQSADDDFVTDSHSKKFRVTTEALSLGSSCSSSHPDRLFRRTFSRWHVWRLNLREAIREHSAKARLQQERTAGSKNGDTPSHFLLDDGGSVLRAENVMASSTTEKNGDSNDDVLGYLSNVLSKPENELVCATDGDEDTDVTVSESETEETYATPSISSNSTRLKFVRDDLLKFQHAEEYTPFLSERLKRFSPCASRTKGDVNNFMDLPPEEQVLELLEGELRFSDVVGEERTETEWMATSKKKWMRDYSKNISNDTVVHNSNISNEKTVLSTDTEKNTDTQTKTAVSGKRRITPILISNENNSENDVESSMSGGGINLHENDSSLENAHDSIHNSKKRRKIIPTLVQDTENENPEKMINVSAENGNCSNKKINNTNSTESTSTHFQPFEPITIPFTLSTTACSLPLLRITSGLAMDHRLTSYFPPLIKLSSTILPRPQENMAGELRMSSESIVTFTENELPLQPLSVRLIGGNTIIILYQPSQKTYWSGLQEPKLEIIRFDANGKSLSRTSWLIPSTFVHNKVGTPVNRTRNYERRKFCAIIGGYSNSVFYILSNYDVIRVTLTPEGEGIRSWKIIENCIFNVFGGSWEWMKNVETAYVVQNEILQLKFEGELHLTYLPLELGA